MSGSGTNELSGSPIRVPALSAAPRRERSDRSGAALAKFAEGLSKPRARRKPEQVNQRIGRLKAKHRRVAGHYRTDLTVEDGRVQSVAWTRSPAKGSMADLPGVYCLRTNLTDWDVERLWRTYVTLTDLEAVFRCLKSELGLRPIHHRAPRRTEGHLFITVVAYQLVQVARRRLRERGHADSWTALRNRLAPDAASPPPSDAPTAAPCTCARPPNSNPTSSPSTTSSASTPTPAASSKRG